MIFAVRRQSRFVRQGAPLPQPSERTKAFPGFSKLLQRFLGDIARQRTVGRMAAERTIEGVVGGHVHALRGGVIVSQGIKKC